MAFTISSRHASYLGSAGRSSSRRLQMLGISRVADALVRDSFVHGVGFNDFAWQNRLPSFPFPQPFRRLLAIYRKRCAKQKPMVDSQVTNGLQAGMASACMPRSM